MQEVQRVGEINNRINHSNHSEADVDLVVLEELLDIVGAEKEAAFTYEIALDATKLCSWQLKIS